MFLHLCREINPILCGKGKCNFAMFISVMGCFSCIMQRVPQPSSNEMSHNKKPFYSIMRFALLAHMIIAKSIYRNKCDCKNVPSDVNVNRAAIYPHRHPQWDQIHVKRIYGPLCLKMRNNCGCLHVKRSLPWLDNYDCQGHVSRGNVESQTGKTYVDIDFVLNVVNVFTMSNFCSCMCYCFAWEWNL